MSKKDRIAIVLSIPCILFWFFAIFNNAPWNISLPIGLIIFGYWGYRFIKGDISFIGSSFKED